jgi:hypothetical protein
MSPELSFISIVIISKIIINIVIVLNVDHKSCFNISSTLSKPVLLKSKKVGCSIAPSLLMLLTPSRGPCHKYFFVCKLRIFELSWSAC